MLEFKHLYDKRYVYALDVNVPLARAIYFNSEQSKAKMLTGIPFTYVISKNEKEIKENLVRTEKSSETLMAYAKEILKADPIEATEIYKTYLEKADDELLDLLGIVAMLFVHSINRYYNHVMGVKGNISNYPEDVHTHDPEIMTLDKHVRTVLPTRYNEYTKYMKEIQETIASSILADNMYVRILCGHELPKPMDKSAVEYRLDLFLPLFFGPIVSLKKEVKAEQTVFYMARRHPNFQQFEDFYKQAGRHHFAVHIDNEQTTNGCVEALYDPTRDLFTCFRCKV